MQIQNPLEFDLIRFRWCAVVEIWVELRIMDTAVAARLNLGVR